MPVDIVIKKQTILDPSLSSTRGHNNKMSDTEDSLSLVQAVRNFGDAAHQLAAAWERQDRRSNIDPASNIQVVSAQMDTINPHISPSFHREPSMEDSTTAMDIQVMDSALQQHCAATADPSAPTQPDNTAPEARKPQQHESKLCLRCFRS